LTADAGGLAAQRRGGSLRGARSGAIVIVGVGWSLRNAAAANAAATRSASVPVDDYAE
jgi:hypothetical protein